jgi:hypothetical protein
VTVRLPETESIPAALRVSAASVTDNEPVTPVAGFRSFRRV